MAVRITHVNNSSGHDGTYVYRSTSPMDPQSLPAPIADAPPATGATFEYIDSTVEEDTYYFRTQDHEGGQVSAVSDEVSIEVLPNYGSAQIGDEIGGGIFVGQVTYGDARQFYLIASKQAGEGSGYAYRNTTEATGINRNWDGKANTDDLVALGGSPAAEYADSYSADGYSDWYLPAENELETVDANLVNAGHTEFSTDTGSYRWSSTESGGGFENNARSMRWTDDACLDRSKTNSVRVRPIRRVAA